MGWRSLLLLAFARSCAALTCDDCASLGRENCGTGEDVCGQCTSLAGPLKGMTECLPCDDETTCNNNGFCRLDQTCGCNPDWYGINCEKQVVLGGFSEVGLVMAVVGLLSSMLLLAFCFVFALRKIDNGCLERSPDDLGGGARHRAAPPERESIALEARRRRSHPQAQAAAPAMADRAMSRLVIEQEKEKNDKHGTSIRVAAAPATTTPNHTNANASSSDAAGASSEMDPPNAQDLVRQLKEIMPYVTNEEALSSLRAHNWMLAQTIPSLMV